MENIKEFPLEDLKESLNTGNINYYNCYNVDLEIPQYYSINHYYENPSDHIDKEQILNTLFFDIEVYCFGKEFNFNSVGDQPISAISFYSKFEKIYYCYFLILDHIESKVKTEIECENFIRKTLLEREYINKEEDVKCVFFYKELDLVTSFWEKVHSLSVSLITGFNADNFDIPYLHDRLMLLFNGDKNKTHRTMSKFGIVKERGFKNKKRYQIAEYPLPDIRHLYLPRDEGGLNYGKKQSSYSLDWISEQELNIKKIEYKDQGLTLDGLYDKDPLWYMLYSIADTALIVRLDDKLKHIELHNMLRRDMKTPFTMSLRGSSALFDSYFSYELELNNSKCKFGIIDEISNSIDNSEIKNILTPNNKYIKEWSIKEVDTETYRKITTRYPGAYVKDSPNVIQDHNDGIIIDLDAKSMYPSMMKQNNISFDTYFGKIIDPNCHKIINLLNSILGTPKQIPEGLNDNIFDLIQKYVEKLEPQNKKEYAQNMYYIIMNCLYKLKSINKSLSKLFNPETLNDYLTLRLYLIPFLDLFDDIHPEGLEVNTFSYEYIINDNFNSDFIYILENDYSPKMKITKIDSSKFIDYIKDNGLCLNISGSLFYNHETKDGIMNKFITERMSLRKTYKNKRDQFEEESLQYEFYDRRQHAMKININSSYGLTGMSTFRFSNRQLAKSTTLSGKLCLKIAQMCGELYLNDMEKQLQTK